MLKEVVLVGMARTPIGDFLASLSSVSAVELGVVAGRAALERAGVKPEQVDDVSVGMVYKAGAKGNPARQIQIALKIPVQAGAACIEQQCASTMRAFEIASQQIMLGKKDVCLVCGIESMSNVPYLSLEARKGMRMGSGKLEDGLHYDALIDAFHGYHVGVTAENLAEEYQITREEQDELAALSHARAIAAIKEGKFKEEIVPVEVKTKKGPILIDTDEHPRADISIETLAKMKPVFKKDGTVTAGNASGLNDGASAAVIMSMDKAKELGIKPLARIVSSATVGCEPRIMGIGPIYAIPKALKEAGLSLQDVDYFEINEAFAAQFIACNRVLKIDMDKVNANGSGIALGHPVGCTGLRIILATYSELVRRGGKVGCASLCAGGGPAMATVIERL
jgi:acetyl-CoA C-acetyltransferase